MSDESKGLTKWQIALLVGAGAVTVAGGALLCYIVSTRRSSRDPGGGVKVGSSSAGKGSTKATSEDGPVPSSSSKTPSTAQNTLERAKAIKQQGNDFYKQQKFDEAIKCYEEAIRVCPPEETEDIAMFHQNLAAAYDVLATKATDEDEKTSHLHSVLEHCNRALTLNNRYVKALTRRLRVHEAMGDKKKALLDVTRVLLLDETQARTLSQMVPNLLKDVGKEQAAQNFPKLGPLAPTKHLVKTYFDSFLWNDDLSEERLKKLWISQVKSPSKTDDQSESTTESHDQVNGTEPLNGEEDSEEQPPTDQSEAQEESHDPFEGYSDEAFVKAVTMFHNEKYNGIIELLTEAIERGNRVFVPHALLLRGSMYALFRQDVSALKDLQAVINTKDLLDQMYISALIRKAGIFAGEGEMEKCKACFDKAFVIDPKSGDAYIHRARSNLEAEDLKQMPSVISDLEEAIKIAPDSPYAAYSLASSYHRLAGLNQSMQILQTAQVKFQEAMQKFPTYADGLVLHALFLQDMNQFKDAEEILNRAVKLEPDNPLTHYSLGLLNLVFTQDLAKATTYLETAISVDNSCVQAYDTLGSLEMQKGNKDRAMDLYDRGIQFSRTKAEMAQAYIAKDVVVAQDQACQEFGISMHDLASKMMPTTLQ